MLQGPGPASLALGPFPLLTAREGTRCKHTHRDVSPSLGRDHLDHVNFQSVLPGLHDLLFKRLLWPLTHRNSFILPTMNFTSVLLSLLSSSFTLWTCLGAPTTKYTLREGLFCLFFPNKRNQTHAIFVNMWKVPAALRTVFTADQFCNRKGTIRSHLPSPRLAVPAPRAGAPRAAVRPQGSWRSAPPAGLQPRHTPKGSAPCSQAAPRTSGAADLLNKNTAHQVMLPP